MLNDIKKDAQTRMAKSVEAFRHDLTKLRTGRATTAMLDGVTAVADLSLEPRGAHLVLHGIKRDLLFGYEFPLLLHFERAGPIDAALVISDPE